MYPQRVNKADVIFSIEPSVVPIDTLSNNRRDVCQQLFRKYLSVDTVCMCILKSATPCDYCKCLSKSTSQFMIKSHATWMKRTAVSIFTHYSSITNRQSQIFSIRI